MIHPLLLASLLLAGETPAGAKLNVPADFTTIQAAVDVAQSGDSIFVKKGFYPGGVTLTAKSGIKIVGLGRPIVDGLSAAVGFSLTACSDVVIGGFEIRNCLPSAVAIFDCKNVRITKCVIEEASGDGIVAGMSDGTHIDGNKLSSILERGISIMGGNGALIEKNLVEDAHAEGIVLVGDGHVVTKNSVLRAGNDGIKIEFGIGGTGIFITKNKVRDSNGEGISVDGTGNLVSGNQLFDGHSDGILVSGGGHLIEKNKITGCQDDGIALEFGAQGGAYRKNLISKVGGDGFDIGGNGNTFEENRVSGAEDGFEMNGLGNTLKKNSATKSLDFDLEDNTFGNTNAYVDNKFKKVGVD